jgi:hypothetical protein
MPLRKIVSLACLIICAACLAVGYALAGQWVIFVVVLIAVLACLFAPQWPPIWLVSVALIGSVSLAAFGLFFGASSTLMVLSVTLALASWDLARFNHTLAGNSCAATLAHLEKKHYENLALALGVGLLLALSGPMIHLQIPFGGMAFLVILAVFSLNRLWRELMD